MVNYTFTTDQGWRVTEYRPFSPSYAVLHTPSLRDYQHPHYDTAHESRYGNEPFASTQPQGLLQKLTGQQLKFDYFSLDVLKQLLEERVAIRDRNRSSILSRISDVSGDIYCAYLLKTPDSYKRRQNLEKTRVELDRQLREEDVTLWRDLIELRRELVLADRTYQSGQLRTGLFASTHSYDDNKGQSHASLSG